MAAEFTRADSLSEYLTGAASDNAAQSDPALSLGNYRSSTLAASMGIMLSSAISNLTVDFAGGGNPIGDGSLQAVDANTLKWKPYGAADYGPPAVFIGPNEVGVVEANANPGQFLRCTGSPPFSLGVCTVTLRPLVANFFGFPEVSSAQATAGVTQYRASVIRNEGPGPVTLFKRWIGTLGTAATASAGQLPAAGAGALVSPDAFTDWPASGFVRVVSNAGTLREIAYYDSRTNSTLNVIARGLLGTAAGAGVSTDSLYPVPGVAIALDPDGVENHGSNIQTIASETTAPTGVTWNTGITEATGLSLATLGVGKQIGFWVKRQLPAGAKASGLSYVRLLENFLAY